LERKSGNLQFVVKAVYILRCKSELSIWKMSHRLKAYAWPPICRLQQNLLFHSFQNTCKKYSKVLLRVINAADSHAILRSIAPVGNSWCWNSSM
jgi:hypothetical protein